MPDQTEQVADTQTPPEAAAPPAESAASTPPEVSDDQWEDAVYSMLEAGEKDPEPYLRKSEPAEPDGGKAKDRAAEPPREPREDTPATTEPEVATRLQALQILRRDGFPESDFENLPDDTVIARAAHRLKVQKDGDRLGSERGQLLQRIEALEASLNGKRPETEPESTMPRDERLDAVMARIKDEVSEEVARELGELLAETRTGLNELSRAREEQLLRSAREGLGDQFPQLKEDANYQKVLQRMELLARTGGYQSLPDLMKDASLLTFGTDVRSAAQREMLRQHQTQANGQPTAPEQKATERTLSPDEREDKVFELLSQGKKPDEARREVYAGMMG